jgi:hypothetical protein
MVSQKTKARFFDIYDNACNISKKVFQWGWIPLIIYLGMTTGSDQKPSFLGLLLPFTDSAPQ